MLEALANLYGDKLLWLLATGEDKYFELCLEKRKYYKTMIAFVKYHLSLNNLTAFDLADYLEVDKEQFFDMCEIILSDILYEEVEDLC